jgi:hypothetical protein
MAASTAVQDILDRIPEARPGGVDTVAGDGQYGLPHHAPAGSKGNVTFELDARLES